MSCRCGICHFEVFLWLLLAFIIFFIIFIPVFMVNVFIFFDFRGFLGLALGLYISLQPFSFKSLLYLLIVFILIIGLRSGLGLSLAFDWDPRDDDGGGGPAFQGFASAYLRDGGCVIK
jgi:hypothetical protein